MEQTGLLQELNLDAMSERMDELFPGFSIDFSGFLEQLLAGNWKDAVNLLVTSLRDGIAGEAAGMKNLFLMLLLVGFSLPCSRWRRRRSRIIRSQTSRIS